MSDQQRNEQMSVHGQEQSGQVRQEQHVEQHNTSYTHTDVSLAFQLFPLNKL